MSELLDRVLAEHPPAFALLHRPEATGPGLVDLLVGEVSEPATLADLPLPADPADPADPARRAGPAGAGAGAGETAGKRHEVLALVPYRQIAERGFEAPDDGTPLLALTVTEQAVLPLAELFARLPDVPITLAGGRFDADDEEYAETVRRVIGEEIGEGTGANFVVKRSFVAEITGYTPAAALTLFRRLLQRETGAYWTFAVHTGERTLVGATPERHISVHGGRAVMNPISGTYRYPERGPDLDGLMDFLADRKEAEELFMVVDEELKMMARICTTGGRVVGPYLKEMARLAHTEYFIEGRTDRDPREVLRETLFAPTVTGSPLESAARVIAKYEPGGRGYYSGVVALIGRDAEGARALDSGILIRTADIDAAGRLRIGVGATLVRHSDPDSEVAETRAKAAGLLAALEDGGRGRFGAHPSVRQALAGRNRTLAGFWLADDGEGSFERSVERSFARAELAGRQVLVVDAEDTFTAMIDHQLRALGLDVDVRRFDRPYAPDGVDLVVLGPGPGDPRDTAHPKIAHLRSRVKEFLAERRPFLAVCLSHQVLCAELGLPLVRRETPNQGVQREIDLFGAGERVGFYNTFAASWTGGTGPEGTFTVPGGAVRVARDAATGEVHALRGPHFASVQFHAESVLTRDGVRIIGDLIAHVLGGPSAPSAPSVPADPGSVLRAGTGSYGPSIPGA
ncbi:anthranilate synthase family protein [Streptomyces sp. BE303]|uniref:anthranilate synthase family protein n=1 Tax=Streptomyces sp. BE303 TaxID=3002528 RepID=UPI002E76078F|nr:anthranilate synthase family protein [Streptomyces sp. BE303]MED7949839.1 anthranilate synthase family protein [Streptomyces sp. BE303]